MALSNTQNARLGAILSVMANEEVPEEYLKKVVDDGFVGVEA